MNDETMCNINQTDPKENNHIIYKIKNLNLYENNLKNKNLNQKLEGYEISRIEKNFYRLQYIWYMITCGTCNKNIAYYENFRQRILSEENIIVSHYNLYKLISLLSLDNSEELILDKKYITIF